jgi:hypothetical protein
MEASADIKPKEEEEPTPTVSEQKEGWETPPSASFKPMPQ